jgi:hypothetical protein
MQSVLQVLPELGYEQVSGDGQPRRPGLARGHRPSGEAAQVLSVTYTYNDPVIFHEYAIDVAHECRQLGIKSVAVTAGFVCEKPRADFCRFMDAANVDLKAFSERFYRKIAGGPMENVLVLGVGSCSPVSARLAPRPLRPQHGCLNGRAIRQ